MLHHFGGLWLHFSFCLHICIVALILAFVHLDFNIVTLESSGEATYISRVSVGLEGVLGPQNLLTLVSETQTLCVARLRNLREDH